MDAINQPLSWEMSATDAYVPLLYEGEMVGLCKPSVAKSVIETLNEDEKMLKALRLACDDLARRLDTGTTADMLMEEYLRRAERPKSGIGAIARLLRERQHELDLNDDEFAKFCDTFRLSRPELASIFAGADLQSQQLSPLSRILGISVDDLLHVWQGFE